MAIRKGNKHQLGLFFLLEACQRNAAGWSTIVWPANAKLPLPHRRSSITRPCCSIELSSANLALLVFTIMHFEVRALDRLRRSERVDALGRRAVEVIICMITRDFSVISMTSQASLSLSLPLTKVTDAQYRKRFRASYNIANDESPSQHVTVGLAPKNGVRWPSKIMRNSFILCTSFPSCKCSCDILRHV